MPTDLSNLLARIGCDVLAAGPAGPAQDAQQIAGQALTTVAETTFTTWLARGAVWILQSDERIVLGASTTPSLDPNRAAAFANVYGRVVGLALAVSVLLLVIAIIEATLTQRPGALRRVVVGGALSGIAMGAVPTGAAMLSRVVDDLSQYVTVGQSQAVPHSLDGLIQVLQTADPLTQTAVFALASLGVMVGGGLLWLELITRESLIYLFIGVAPLACAAVQWPRLEGVLRQVLFGGLALIVSKLVIAISLVVGFSVLTSGAGLENLLGGMFLLIVTAMMPFATARVLPIAADELTRGHQGQLRVWATSSVGNVRRSVTAIATGGATGVPALVGLSAAVLGRSGPRKSDDASRGASRNTAATNGAGWGPWGRPTPSAGQLGEGRTRGRRAAPPSRDASKPKAKK